MHTAATGSLIEVADARAARAAVRRVRREGADFVKVYSRLSPEVYRAIADEARRQGIPYAGHCPDEVTLAEASGLGQRSVEHLHALLLATSSREREIRRGLAAVRVDPAQTDPVQRYSEWFQQIHPLEHEAVRSFDPTRTDALFAELATHGTRIVPTLAVHRTLELPDENRTRPEEWKYLPGWLTEGWAQQMETVTAVRTPRQVRQVRQIHDHRRRLVARLLKNGVPLLAGTDTGNPYLVPGFALHRELELLVDAGLSPHQALRAATHEAARALGLDGTVGTVARGKAADLVVLDRDPLRDIANTRAVHSLLVAGRLITRERRRELLAEVARVAAASEPPRGTTTAAAGCGCAGLPAPAQA